MLLDLVDRFVLHGLLGKPDLTVLLRCLALDLFDASILLCAQCVELFLVLCDLRVQFLLCLVRIGCRRLPYVLGEDTIDDLIRHGIHSFTAGVLEDIAVLRTPQIEIVSDHA